MKVKLFLQRKTKTEEKAMAGSSTGGISITPPLAAAALICNVSSEISLDLL